MVAIAQLDPPQIQLKPLGDRRPPIANLSQRRLAGGIIDHELGPVRPQVWLDHKRQQQIQPAVAIGGRK